MKIHEYQARQLLADAGIPVPPGACVTSADAAEQKARELLGPGCARVVVKAQVHAGGRGKAGFVKLVGSPREAGEAARFMLSHRMVSPQTGPQGLEVTKLLVAAAVDIAREYYLAVTVDRRRGANALIASAQGGVEIEAVAERSPEAIVTVPMHPLMGLQPYQARAVAFRLGLAGTLVAQCCDVAQKLSTLFVDTDASLAEINPLAVTPPAKDFSDGRLVAIDAKFSLDDSALYRRQRIAGLFDPAEENASELRAKAAGLSYVAMEGTIGCLVNGAGLAMSTMDIIKLHGGEPANFLDVGGSATEESVTEAFRIILEDGNVRAVLVNIFGGIMQCDKIARAIIAAAKEVGFRVPLVVRLEGTNVAEARKILEAARGELPTMVAAADLTDAAKKVCAAAKKKDPRALFPGRAPR
jgi:succinyl-CoA synthetase beta subunit